MKKFKFILISIKNNFRRMPLVYALMCIIFTACFVFQGMVVRIFSVSAGDAPIFLGVSAIIVIFCALLMIKVFKYYFAESTHRRTVYAMLGAKFDTTAAGIILETLMMYLLALAVGTATDSIIASFVSITETGYMDGKLFGMAAGWTFLLPLLSVTMSLSIERLKLRRAIKIRN